MKHDYDLAVIGGGAAGLVASKFAAGVGKRVVLIEKSRLGGECTLYGCVPSKTLIRSAKVCHEMAQADSVGLVGNQSASVAGDEVLGRVRRVVERIYSGHSPDALERQGIRVIIGSPRFIDNHAMEVDGRIITASSSIICTGSSPLVPPIDGIDSVPYLTNETLFDMEALPRSMIILGGGPIGIEIAQALRYLNVDVTVVEMAERILVREDHDLSDLLTAILEGHGIALRTGAKAVGMRRKDVGLELTVENGDGKRSSIQGETVLIALGRKANIESLGLEAAGIEYSPKGIRTDRRLRTTTPNIYACGDVVGPYQFSHMAEYQARIAARNALFPLKGSADYKNYLWCTFTDPELAHAGLTETEAREQYGDRIRIYKWQYRDTDRGKTDAAEAGLGKFICDGSYNLLGAHILGVRAGEMIHEAQIVKTFGIPFHRLDSVIHVYPTFSDVLRQPAKMAHIDKLQNNIFVKAGRRMFGKRRSNFGLL